MKLFKKGKTRKPILSNCCHLQTFQLSCFHCETHSFRCHLTVSRFNQMSLCAEMIEKWLKLQIKFSPKSNLWYFLCLLGRHICFGTQLGLTDALLGPRLGQNIINRTQDGGTKCSTMKKLLTNSKKISIQWWTKLSSLNIVSAVGLVFSSSWSFYVNLTVWDPKLNLK